jgi:hypothetical protein
VCKLSTNNVLFYCILHVSDALNFFPCKRIDVLERKKKLIWKKCSPNFLVRGYRQYCWHSLKSRVTRLSQQRMQLSHTDSRRPSISCPNWSCCYARWQRSLKSRVTRGALQLSHSAFKKLPTVHIVRVLWLKTGLDVCTEPKKSSGRFFILPLRATFVFSYVPIWPLSS